MQGIQTPLATRYGAAITVMERMGWSWEALASAPHDLVQELLIRSAAENEWTAKKQKIDKGKAGTRPPSKSGGGGRRRRSRR